MGPRNARGFGTLGVRFDKLNELRGDAAAPVRFALHPGPLIGRGGRA